MLITVVQLLSSDCRLLLPVCTGCWPSAACIPLDSPVSSCWRYVCSASHHILYIPSHHAVPQSPGLRTGDVQSVQRVSVCLLPVDNFVLYHNDMISLSLQIQSSIRIEQLNMSALHQNSVLAVAGSGDTIISTVSQSLKESLCVATCLQVCTVLSMV